MSDPRVVASVRESEWTPTPDRTYIWNAVLSYPKTKILFNTDGATVLECQQKALAHMDTSELVPVTISEEEAVKNKKVLIFNNVWATYFIFRPLKQ